MRKIALTVAMSLILLLSACGGTASKDNIEVIKLADAGWDSIRIHNSVAQIIIEDGYGYETEVINGTSAATFQALEKGDLNVYMEVWTDNLKEIYEAALENETILSLATNFDDNAQGLYVPTYVIEGDAERGIEAVAPDLKTVEDLANYPEIFPDPEDKKMGRIVGAPSSWILSEFLAEKIETYGLDDKYNYLAPGSDSAIVASLVGAYNKGEPWVGYYWSPTSITAEYDLTLLEDNPYDEAIWDENKGTEFAPDDVVVAAHKDLATQAADVVEFLTHYTTSSQITEDMLNYMAENETDPDETAIWWLTENEDLWTTWVPKDIADKVKESLN